MACGFLFGTTKMRQIIAQVNSISLTFILGVLALQIRIAWVIDIFMIVKNEESSSKNSVKLYSDIENIIKNNKLKQEDKYIY